MSLFSIGKAFNRLLPFATPGTPVVQDIVHLAALCTILYFAPQIQTYIKQRLSTNHDRQGSEADQPANDHADNPVVEQTHNDPAQERVDNDAARGLNEDTQPATADINHDEPQAPDPAPENDMPGPADGPDPARLNATRTREVGKKKAASLARRDQRRAYHEFLRSQTEAENARYASVASEREAEMAAERERRAKVEAEVREREKAEREQRRERERREWVAEGRRREGVVESVRTAVRNKGLISLDEVGGRFGEEGGWVEGLVRASGILGRREGEAEMVMLTEEGWVVKVGREDMESAYRVVLSDGNVRESSDGIVTFEQIGGALENVIRSRAAAAAG